MGHCVLIVPVPALDTFVRARWEHHDPAWVSRDPAFVHAHVTVLAPFLPDPDAADLAAVGAIAAQVAPFDVGFDAVEVFADGIIHTRPAPSEPFALLTARVAAAFPQCPPYEGRFAELVPHVTLDHTMTGESVASMTGALHDAGSLPTLGRAEHLDLQWYEEGGCRLLARWELGTGVRVVVPTRAEPDPPGGFG